MPHEQKVHIIDDDQAVRDSLAFLLQSMRIPAAVHESGSAFLAAFGFGEAIASSCSPMYLK